MRYDSLVAFKRRDRATLQKQQKAFTLSEPHSLMAVALKTVGRRRSIVQKFCKSCKTEVEIVTHATPSKAFKCVMKIYWTLDANARDLRAKRFLTCKSCENFKRMQSEPRWENEMEIRSARELQRSCEWREDSTMDFWFFFRFNFMIVAAADTLSDVK